MRHLTTILALGTTLCGVPLAHAATRGAACRSACAPRVAEQCPDLEGRDLRRCRRPLLRACKATTPAQACPTTADVTRDFADVRVDVSGDESLLLCADGRFVSNASDGSPGSTRGTWHVALVDGALALDLVDDDGGARRLSPARDGAGGFVIDGVTTIARDASAACARLGGGATPDPARVLAVARAVTDCTLGQVRLDDLGHPLERIELALCSSGTVHAQRQALGEEPDVTEFDEGTWTIDDGGASIVLDLEQGTRLLPDSFEVTLLDDHRVLLNGAPAAVGDARGFCAERELEDRLADLLVGSSYPISSSADVHKTLVFCGVERVLEITRTTSSRRSIFRDGDWTIQATAGVVTLHLRFEDGQASEEHTLTQTADGMVLIDDVAPSLGATCP